MKVVISMSGMSSRFTEAGYTIPKFMINIDGKLVIEHIIDLYPTDSDFLFIINDKHQQDTNIVSILNDLRQKKNIKDIDVVVIKQHKKGPVFSIDTFGEYIDDNDQVVINYCDFSMYWDYNDFEQFVNETDCDGCVVCYTGFHPHMLGSDNYAFCRTDGPGELEIREIREKEPFTDDKMSEFASTGTYYFKKGSYVKKYFKELIEKDININCEYYVSLVHNLLIEDGLTNLVYEIPHMLQWGTPFDVDVYRSWSGYFQRAMTAPALSAIRNQPPSSNPRIDRVKLPECVTLLPMAGWGNRFAQVGYQVPKPCIQVNGHYMMDRSLVLLPHTRRTILGALERHKDLLPLTDYGDVLWLDEVLPGQACTTERIVRYGKEHEIIGDNTSLLVSACDNACRYDGQLFNELVSDKSNDIIVWTFKSNFTTWYNPNAYSWVKVDDNDNITHVSVKEFIGEHPLFEPAITGTMFFRNSDIFEKSLSKLYEKNIRTNGEFYLDTLLNEAIDLGYKVKNFQVGDYVCWGTPVDLLTYQYWQQFFDKVDWHSYKYDEEYLTIY